MKKKSSKKLPVGRWLGYAALVILAIISIGPLWIALKTALSGPTAWPTSAGSLASAKPSGATSPYPMASSFTMDLEQRDSITMIRSWLKR